MLHLRLFHLGQPIHTLLLERFTDHHNKMIQVRPLWCSQSNWIHISSLLNPTLLKSQAYHKVEKMASHIVTVSGNLTSNLNHMKQFMDEVERDKKKIVCLCMKRWDLPFSTHRIYLTLMKYFRGSKILSHALVRSHECTKTIQCLVNLLRTSK